MLRSETLQVLLKRLSVFTHVEANTEKFKGRFKFSKVRGLTNEGKELLFFYNEEDHLLFTCDSYYLSRIKDGVIYINC